MSTKIDSGSPAILAFVRELTGASFLQILLGVEVLFGEQHRNRLIEYLPRIAAAGADEASEIRRAFITTDYAVRSFAPIGLGLSTGDELAKQLADLPPIVDWESIPGQLVDSDTYDLLGGRRQSVVGHAQGAKHGTIHADLGSFRSKDIAKGTREAARTANAAFLDIRGEIARIIAGGWGARHGRDDTEELIASVLKCLEAMLECE